MRSFCLAALCFASLAWPLPAAAAPDAGLPAAGATVPPRRAAPADSGVRNAERMRAQALAQRDIEALRRLISGDYYHVESNGRVRTKTEFLQALARNEFRIRSYGLDDMEIKLVDDGGTAIVTGTYHAASQDRSTAQPVRGRYVRIWTRYPDGWRNALHQSTAIRPATASPAGPASSPALQ